MKKFLTWFALLAILICCVSAASNMGLFDRTYNPENGNSVYDMMTNGATEQEDAQYSGAADAIVQQNLEKTHSVNDVTSIVFDFRGYDTMGEAFILITAVAGSIVILSNHKKKEDKKDEQ